MPKKLPHFGLVILVTAAFACAGNIIDRIVATVNGHIILESDWDEAVSYEAFVNRRPLDHLTLGDRKAALDRLIDQELIRQQIHARDFQHPSATDIDHRVAEIRMQHAAAADDLAWKAASNSTVSQRASCARRSRPNSTRCAWSTRISGPACRWIPPA